MRILILITIALLFSCNANNEKYKVIEEYPDGLPKMIDFYKNGIDYKTVLLSETGDTLSIAVDLPNSKNFVLNEFDDGKLKRKTYMDENAKMFLRYKYVQDTIYLYYKVPHENVTIEITYYKNEFICLAEELSIGTDKFLSSIFCTKNDTIDNRRSVYVIEKNDFMIFVNFPKDKVIYSYEGKKDRKMNNFKHVMELDNDSLMLSPEIKDLNLIICSKGFNIDDWKMSSNDFIYFYPVKYNLPDSFNLPEPIMTSIQRE